MNAKDEGAQESTNESPTRSDSSPELTQDGSRDVLTHAELNELRVSLHAQVAKEKDQFMRSHISNLAEVIENYLKEKDVVHQMELRMQMFHALVRLENFRARQQQREG